MNRAAKRLAEGAAFDGRTVHIEVSQVPCMILNLWQPAAKAAIRIAV